MSEYVRKYASEEALRQNGGGDGVSSSSESSMSDYSEDEAQVLYIFIRLPKEFFLTTRMSIIPFDPRWL